MSKAGEILPPWTVAPCIDCSVSYQATRTKPGVVGLCDRCEGVHGRDEQAVHVAELERRLAESEAKANLAAVVCDEYKARAERAEAQARGDTEGMRKVRIVVGVRPNGQWSANGAFCYSVEATMADMRDSLGPARFSIVEAWVPVPKVEPVVTVAGVVADDVAGVG